tara:strand:- start:284 stop:814 length:531 start_codon:yes stop_codon:yes gene_type:complete
MKNFLTKLVVPLKIVLIVLFFPVSAAEGNVEQPPVYFDLEILERKPFPYDIEWWPLPLTRDRVFMDLDLTRKQKDKIDQLKKQYKQRILDFKTQHHESLLNVLDDDQRRKLEEKRGEIYRYFEKITPLRRFPHYYRLKEDSRYTNPLQIDSSLKTINTTQDVMTWGLIKKNLINSL